MYGFLGLILFLYVGVAIGVSIYGPGSGNLVYVIAGPLALIGAGLSIWLAKTVETRPSNVVYFGLLVGLIVGGTFVGLCDFYYSAPVSTAQSLWHPLSYTSADVSIVGNTYANAKNGFSITFPPGWNVTKASDIPSALVKGQYASTTVIVSATNYMGSFSTSTPLLATTVGTDLINTILSSYINNGWTLLSSNLSTINLPFGATSSSTTTTYNLGIVAEQRGASGYIGADYSIFGTGPTVYIVLVLSPESDSGNSAYFAKAFASILDSIRLPNSE